MKKILIADLITVVISVFLLAACVIVPAGERGHRPGGVVIAPLLPSVVVLESEPYYSYSDFQYHYTNDRWYYAQSRRGPWAELPRDRYPKEVRYKGKPGNQGRGTVRSYENKKDRDSGNNRDRDYENNRDRDYDNQRE